MALDLKNGPVRFTTITGGTADQFHILMPLKEHHGRRQPLTVGIRDDFRIAIRFQVGQPGERGAKVNANVFSHSRIR